MKKRSEISESRRGIQRESSHPSTSSDSLGLAPQFKGELQKLFSPKPQIKTIPGVAIGVQKRYRVLLADDVLGDFLSIDEALELAKGGGK